MNNPEEFYIGWESKAAPGVARGIRRAVIILLALAAAGAIAFAVAQQLIGNAVFEWGTIKTFDGTFRATPYPHLLVRRPGDAGSSASSFSTYYLVAPWKFGLDHEAVASLDGKAVRLKGTLIYRGNQTMIETKPEWIETADGEGAGEIGIEVLGRRTFAGEIVDSKCFLGVMNPGQLTPHRACAIRCISGGVPPVLLVRQENGPPIYLLLVSADGRPVNKQILDLVALPVEITGEVQRQGELFILRADPKDYRRLNP